MLKIFVHLTALNINPKGMRNSLTAPNHDSGEDFHVVVVGAGPAGSTVATLVALQGNRVLLLEKERLPFYKIGESLLPATIHGICPLLGVSKAIEEANFVPKAGGTFRWGTSTEPWTFSFASSSAMEGPTSKAYQVERMKFDQILLNNAREKGVDVREDHKVTTLLVENDRVVGVRFVDSRGAIETCRARYVVDASGHQTAISKFAGERIYSNFFQNIALFGYYRNGGRLPEPNQGNIFCAAFEHGWFWYIPLTEDLTSVGAVVGKEHSSKLTQGHEPAMDEFIRSCPHISQLLRRAERIKEGPYGELRVRKDYSYSHTRFWAPGLVLVGDAACFIDPVFSSGVHLATYSALLAARSINTCLGGKLDEQQCFAEFERRYRREYSYFYDFLLAFYDVDNDLDSYYWHARKVMNSPELGNEAFINLVAGVGQSGERLYPSAEEYLKEREGIGNALFQNADNNSSYGSAVGRRNDFYMKFLGEITQVQMQALLKDKRPAEEPLFSGGLVPSLDGLHWSIGGDLGN
jgi:FAD-dependent halogenase